LIILTVKFYVLVTAMMTSDTLTLRQYETDNKHKISK